MQSRECNVLQSHPHPLTRKIAEQQWLHVYVAAHKLVCEYTCIWTENKNGGNHWSKNGETTMCYKACMLRSRAPQRMNLLLYTWKIYKINNRPRTSDYFLSHCVPAFILCLHSLYGFLFSTAAYVHSVHWTSVDLLQIAWLPPAASHPFYFLHVTWVALM